MNKIYKIKLSPYHKIFYNEWQLDPSSSKYNIVFDQAISNTLDIFRLKNALERLITDHLILNSHVTVIDGEPHWITNSVIRQLDIFNGFATYEQIFAYVSQPFNVNEEPLYRFAIFNQADGNYRFVIVWHHLIMDGSSGDESINLISAYYNDAAYKLKLSIENQYHSLVATNSLLQKQLKENTEIQKIFWSNLLRDVEPIDLAFLKPSSHNKSDNLEINKNPIHELCFGFTSSDFLKSSQMIRKYGITPYMYSKCIFASLIYRYTNQSQFGFCYPISIKEHLGLLYGVAINTNVGCYNLTHNSSIIDLFTQIKNRTDDLKNRGQNYRYYPISKILAGINKNILDVFFIQSNLKNTCFAFNDAQVLKINAEFNVDVSSKLLFEQEYRDGKLNFRVRYNITEIDESILKHFINHYQKLFMDVLADLEQGNVNKCLSEYQILTTEEYNKIVYEWNKTDKAYPSDKTIHQLFEEQVLKTPDSIAVVYEDSKLTYNELNQRANQLAHYIKDKYLIKPDDLILLCLERSEYLIIAILAVLKSGGAYVPIDIKLPAERLKYILKQTNAKSVITNKKFLHGRTFKEIQSTPINALFEVIDDIELSLQLSNKSDMNIDISIKSTGLAYVIYTSGTTGVPKGVLQQHNNVARLFSSTDAWFKFDNKDVWVLFHSYVFDFSVWEMWGALFYGGKLIIPSNAQIRDFEQFYNLVKNENVTVLNQTPSSFYHFSQVAIEKFEKQKLLNLRYVIFGGEALNFAQLNLWYSYYTKMPQLINMYGITETTVHVTYYPIRADNINTISLIGKGIPDQRIYLLNKLLQPLPIGAIGELYVGGAGLARGYLNLPELTAERFIANPFQSETEKLEGKNDRLYKTGDLCRFLPDGNIEYIGRNDCQIKIRGYRIELSEIESVLNKYAAIRQSVVLCKNIPENSNNKYLVAYYVADQELSNEEIMNYLAGQLPQYMIPNILVHIPQIPLTINGKLDKAALPTPSFEPDVNDYIAPRNEMEQIICKCFADTLSVSLSQISVNSDFFKLGGDSLLVISLVVQLQQNHLIIGADEIFKLRTPEKIAHNVQYHQDYLKKQFHNMKRSHAKVQNVAEKDILAMTKKKDAYLQSIKQLQFEQKLKPITNVLLTGATGHLGCYILYQLLATTPCKIILLIRAGSNDEAFNRINAKFNYYFGTGLIDYRDRVVALASDLEKDNLGLDDIAYASLGQTIDSIIHSAALVSHYGDHNVFYRANVQATISLLELAKLTQLKDFHYISTASVLTDGYIPECGHYSYTEDDDVSDKLIRGSNIYCQTKFDGEMAVIKYREHGIKSNIYRVGNLSVNSQNHKIQEDFENNAFFLRTKTILKLGIIPQELVSVKISPVDCTALAIVKLFQQESLSNKIYHVFNPNPANLYELFVEYGVDIKLLPFNDFIDTIVERLQTKTANDDTSKLLELFILHQGWLRTDINTDNITKIEVLQDRTEAILSQLDFTWPRISSNMLSEIINKSF